ncbi:MAG: flagellar filament capping protein FliD [Dictyoglomi bacterium]|nr:flagellar filament capping protein FliD [Dictyoglomota bacterium]
MISGVSSFNPLATREMVDKYISALMAPARKPIDLLNNQKALIDKQVKALNEIKGILSSMKDLAHSLADPVLGAWRDKEVSVSNDDVASVSVTSSATEGVWDLTVNRVATAHRVISSQVAKTDTNLVNTYGGKLLKLTFNLKDGTTSTVNVDLTDITTDNGSTNIDVLNKIADAINSASDAGVKAVVIGTDPDNVRLSIYATSVGSDKAIDSMSAEESSDGGNTYSASNLWSDLALDDLSKVYDPTDPTSGGSIAPEGESGTTFDYDWLNLDAVLSGVPIKDTDNTISDGILGATITVKSTGSTTISIRDNVDNVVKKIEDFMNKFTELNAKIRAYTFAGSDKAERGVLANDTSIRMTLYAIREAMTAAVKVTVGSDTETFTGEKLGITFDKEGNLTFDSSIIRNMLSGSEEDREKIIKAFTQSTENGDPEDGIFVRLEKKLETYVDSVSGLFTTRINSLNERKDYIDERIKTLEKMLDAKEQMYREQLGNLMAMSMELKQQVSEMHGIFGGTM